MQRTRVLCILMLIYFAAICAATAADTSFFFIQLADTQMGFTNNGKDMIPEIEHFKAAVGHINRLKPAFVLISGDLVNYTHSPKQIRAFWSEAREIDPSIPLYLVPGNHDVGKAKAEDIKSYEKLMGKDHYSFSYNGSEFIVLDSPLLSDAADKDLREAQQKWFETELANAHAKNPTHIFVCDHHPWFLNTPDEPDHYQNVPLAYRSTYLDLMNRYGVDYALCGHLHFELIGHDRNLMVLTDGALSKSIAQPAIVGFRIIHVSKDRIEHRFYSLDNVPERFSDCILIPQ